MFFKEIDKGPTDSDIGTSLDYLNACQALSRVSVEAKNKS